MLKNTGNSDDFAGHMLKRVSGDSWGENAIMTISNFMSIHVCATSPHELLSKVVGDAQGTP